MTSDYPNNTRTIGDLVESDPRLAAAGVQVSCRGDGNDLVQVVLAGPKGDRVHFVHELLTGSSTGDLEQADLLVNRILRIEAAA
jgi:hypothetical protein